MDGLGIDRFSLMCWSGGGPSTYRLAVRHPDRVQALVTLAAVSQEDHWHDSFVERFAFETRFGNWLLRQYAHIAPKSFVSATLAAEGKPSRHQLKELTTSVMANPTNARSFCPWPMGRATATTPRRNQK
jgi:pimeloyl-ACP methyl ester carboxylesterase